MRLAARDRAPAGLTGRPVYELQGVSKTFARRNVNALDNYLPTRPSQLRVAERRAGVLQRQHEGKPLE